MTIRTRASGRLFFCSDFLEFSEVREQDLFCSAFLCISGYTGRNLVFFSNRFCLSGKAYYLIKQIPAADLPGSDRVLLPGIRLICLLHWLYMQYRITRRHLSLSHNRPGYICRITGFNRFSPAVPTKSVATATIWLWYAGNHLVVS